MGGEANYLFAFSEAAAPHYLAPVPREQWLTPPMARWAPADIAALLDAAEAALRECVRALALPATQLHGYTPASGLPAVREAVAASLRLARAQPGPFAQAPVAAIEAGEGEVVIRTERPFLSLPAFLAATGTIILSPAAYDAAGAVRVGLVDVVHVGLLRPGDLRAVGLAGGAGQDLGLVAHRGPP